MRKTIALILPIRVPHIDRTLQGLRDYARRRTRWVFAANLEFPTGVRSLRGWAVDGALVFLSTPAEEDVLLNRELPAVNLSGALRAPRIPRVMIDNAAVGRLAAEHLLACGFSRFGYYGLRGVWYAEERKRGFVERLRREGLGGAVYDEIPRREGSWVSDPDRLERWLAALPKPAGLFACTDQRALAALEACRRLRIDVPRRLGLIGVDNDELTCETCRPTLSSISRNAYQIGVEAGRLLDRLLRGDRPPAMDILIEPGEVVRRESTDVFAAPHPVLRRAVAFVRAHVGEPFGVEALLKQAGVSRRTLETLFRRHMRCAPYRFILRMRAERARELLRDAEPSSIKRIAAACGLTSGRHLNRVLRQVAGVTPRQVRESARRGGG
jgi:LacI family transcriptional regulator